MKIIVLISSLIFMCGCVTNQSISKKMELPSKYEISKIVAKEYHKKVEVCEDEYKKNTPKEDRLCEMVSYNYILDNQGLEKHCQKNKISTKECHKMAMESFQVRSESYYPYADFNDALRQCKAEPIECGFGTKENLSKLEFYFMMSNEFNRIKLAKQEKDANEKRERETEEDYNTKMAAFANGVGNALSNSSQRNKTTECVSEEDYFGKIRTTCN